MHMLPMVVEGGSQVGGLCKDWFGIKRGTPVLVGLGDLQCSYLSAVKSETDAGNNVVFAFIRLLLNLIFQWIYRL